ncbi:unnamed protein product [Blepharisma stoltei]|uniref:Hexose transporter 1 n=1 Tax=Blepharisma stoltei TaxID=1481888 RepID=A0AAU9JED8_9CILI|nr:unnamed protein product [Blepharisma stoltei]
MSTAPASQEIYNSKSVWRIGFHIAIGFFIIGCNLGNYNSVQNNISDTLHWKSHKDLLIPLMAALMPIGAIFGSILASPLSNKKGRRKAFIFSDIISIISSIFFIIPFTECFAIGRFLSGFASGLFTVLCPVYIFERAPIEIGGKIGALISMNLTFGIVLMYALALPLPEEDCEDYDMNYWWIFMFSIQGIAGIIQLVLFMVKYKYDSPIWLVEKNRIEEARKSSSQIYRQDSVTNIIQTLQKIIEESKAGENLHGSKYSDLFLCRKHHSKTLRIGCMFNIIYQICGINAILTYSTKIFSDFGDEFLARVLTLSAGFANMGSALFLFPLIDKYKRKPTLCWGCLGMAICLIFLGAFSLHYTSMLPHLIFILAYLIFFEISIGPLCWIILGEILDEKESSICYGLCWTAAAVVVFIFPLMYDGIGISITFFIFGGICLLSIIYFWCDLIETRGKSRTELRVELYRKQ